MVWGAVSVCKWHKSLLSVGSAFRTTLCTQFWTLRKITGSRESVITRSPDRIAIGYMGEELLLFSSYLLEFLPDASCSASAPPAP